MKSVSGLTENSKESFLFYVSRLLLFVSRLLKYLTGNHKLKTENWFCATENWKQKTENLSFNLLETVNRKLITVLFILFAVFLLMALPAWAGINQWTSNGPYMIRPSAMVFDPSNSNTAYVTTFYGLINKSTDGGITWQQIYQGGNSIYTVAVDPQNSNVLYFSDNCASGRIFKSTNGGLSWNLINSTIAPHTILVDPNDSNILYFGVYGAGVYKSTDGGSTLTQINTGLDSFNITELAIDPSDTSTLFVGESMTGVYRSANGGTSWQKVTGTLMDSMYINSIFIDGGNHYIYVSTSSGIYKSDDLGANWTLLISGSFNGIRVDPIDSNILFSVAGNYVYKSTDGGSSWSDISYISGFTLQGITVAPNIICVYSQHDIWRSSDGGDTWSNTTAPFSENVAFSLAINPQNSQIIYTGGQYTGIHKSTDGGGSWQFIWGFGSDATDILIDPTNPLVLYVAGHACHGVLKSVDGGQNWTCYNDNNIGWVRGKLAFEPGDTDTIYAAASNGVFRSVDGGVNWVLIFTNTLDASEPISIAIDPYNTSKMIIITSSFVFMSLDYGTTWANLSIPSLGYWGGRSVVFDPNNSNNIYIGGGGIYKSTDGGTSWTHIDMAGGQPSVLSLAIDTSNPAIIWAGTYSGVYVSTDHGNTWQTMNSGLQNFNINSIKIDPNNHLHLYTASGAINKSADNGIVQEAMFSSLPTGDTAPPNTTASPVGGTFASAQNVTLTCNDGSGSGCQTTRYCLGSGCTPSTIYNGAINISSSSTLRFYSTDNSNNDESVKTETYTITIAPVTHTITASAGANGSISPSGAVVVNHGANQSFTITPNTNYYVADVLVDGSSVGAVTSYTFNNATTDHTISASFAIYSADTLLVESIQGNFDNAWAVIPVYSRDDNSSAAWCGCNAGGGHGHFDSTWGPITVPPSKQVTFKYQTPCTDDSNPNYDIYIISGSDPSGSGTLIYSITRDSYCSWSNPIMLDLSSVTTTITFYIRIVVSDPNDYLSMFLIEPTHTITASAGANGSITPSGAVSVNHGSNQSFTITPNTNYHVADVLVDDVSQGSITT